ncbi:MAG TPA: hypothetical protein VMC85_20860 [Desulfomonilaceae bacterium]|nr:hypothetical protein [Desulfomonilaceae bacterium]
MKLDIPGIDGSLGECVLCGESFLKEIMLNQTVATIHLDGFNAALPIHKETCLPALEKNGPDWKTLPDGPLRREFAKHFSEAVQS